MALRGAHISPFLFVYGIGTVLQYMYMLLGR
jgi:hypothetical protein